MPQVHRWAYLHLQKKLVHFQFGALVSAKTGDSRCDLRYSLNHHPNFCIDVRDQSRWQAEQLIRLRLRLELIMCICYSRPLLHPNSMDH